MGVPFGPVRARRRARGVAGVALGVAAFVAGSTGCTEPPPAGERPPASIESEAPRVTGIGGIFFKSRDPAGTLAWYRTHLGIASGDLPGFAFQWSEKGRPDETGYTIWSTFPDTSSYFSPGDQRFMVNFRVRDLAGLIAALRAEGVEIVGGIEQHPNGKFAWILDPEGRKVELWEPVPSEDDPYLR